MSPTDVLMIVPDSPGLSALVWFVLGSALLYLARIPAHHTIHSFSRIIHNAMRITSNAIITTAQKLRDRNREVLIEMGRDSAERVIEREFQRVESIIKRDLNAYPALHRKLSEQISAIDEDYRHAIDQPPEPPGWIKAVETVANLPASKDPNVADVLEEMQKAMEKSQISALDQYRKASRERHGIMRKMMPQWRRVSEVLQKVGTAVKDVNTRSKSIDQHLIAYQELNTQPMRSERTLSSSSIAQFFIALTVLSIAFGGALVNFKLIAYPMQELMTGGRSFIGSFQTGDVSALVIILFEIVMGILLLESLRITRLFPEIGALDDRHRIPMIWIFFTILLFFASIEASLAYMRDFIQAEDAAIKKSIAGATLTIDPTFRWLGTAGQMALGFVLPFALAFVGIPLESFVKAARTVGGYFVIGILYTVAFSLRLIGNLVRFGGATAANLYDLLVFGPLWIERLFLEKRANKSVQATRMRS